MPNRLFLFGTALIYKEQMTYTYPDNYESKVDFISIRHILREYCLCPLGIEKVDGMTFMTSHDIIRRKVKQTMEFVRIIKEEDFPDQNFFDMRSALKRIRIDNAHLEVEELFSLQRSLDTICKIHTFLRRSANTSSYEDDDFIPLFPTLYNLTKDISTFPQVVRQIDRILDKYGNIKDSASLQLMRIRHEIANTTQSVSRLLGNILKTAKSEGLVEKDLSPTMRDGRLVIPVAPAMKRKIKGIVYDESDSGRTIYIEPAEVVEANNRIRELESEERKEIKRILKEFSATLRPDLDNIISSYEILAETDFIRSKAKFAISTNSSEPNIENKQILNWKRAIHPLLEMSLSKSGKKVVPLDLVLTSRQRILLISGPNAGGKSVCLKTVGLLQYMLQCGMPVPMDENSQMGIFHGLFIDIGDEQSIEDDLSTYSSHLLNMKNMMRRCNSATLIMIDEFGTGTEPQIGGAIAEAILTQFNNKKTYGVITTHYQNLKHFAQSTEGIVNGAMLYNRQQMLPLFQLRIGNPGSSFAIEIARKTGIPESVINHATEIVGKDYIDADKYLQDITRDKYYWENKRQTIHHHEKQMEKTIERYEEETKKLHEERRSIIAKAKEEAEELLKSANARIEQTIREIKEAQAERERTRTIRQQMADYRQEVKNIDAEGADDRIRRQMEKIMARQNRLKNKKKTSESAKDTKATTVRDIHAEEKQAHTFRPGDYVTMEGQSTIGQIMKITTGKATVVFGNIQTIQPLERLIPSTPPKAEKRSATFVSKQTQDEIREKTLNFRQDIDVRGMRADEAIQAVTYYIDDALVANVSRVRILHGTGNGILRTMIRQYLNTIPAISDYHDEHVQFGGAGITVVEIV